MWTYQLQLNINGKMSQGVLSTTRRSMLQDCSAYSWRRLQQPAMLSFLDSWVVTNEWMNPHIFFSPSSAYLPRLFSLDLNSAKHSSLSDSRVPSHRGVSQSYRMCHGRCWRNAWWLRMGSSPTGLPLSDPFKGWLRLQVKLQLSKAVKNIKGTFRVCFFLI